MNIHISNADPDPIYLQVMKQIQKHIVSGELNPGEQLPSIRRLALDLQISVITTKRAYDELEHDGYINTVSGKGSFIADQSQDMLQERRMKQVEEQLSQAVAVARSLGVNAGDLHTMIDLLMEDDR